MTISNTQSAHPLSKASYVSLSTFRKSGKQVATPVWCAPADGVLFVFSAGEAGKIKRLRSSNKARLAACDMKGKLLGEWFDATAEILQNRDDIDRALAALRKKYGWQMHLADLGAKITGKFDKRAYIKLQVLGTKE